MLSDFLWIAHFIYHNSPKDSLMFQHTEEFPVFLRLNNIFIELTCCTHNLLVPSSISKKSHHFHTYHVWHNASVNTIVQIPTLDSALNILRYISRNGIAETCSNTVVNFGGICLFLSFSTPVIPFYILMGRAWRCQLLHHY